MPPPAFTLFDFEVIFLVHLYSMLGETPPSMFSSPRIVRWPWLVLKSWNLRGMGKKDMCPLGQTLRLWNLSHTPQLPKPESASGLNARSLRWHLGFQNGGDARQGEPWGVITIPPCVRSRGRVSSAAAPTSYPSLLFSLPLFWVPSLWFYETEKTWKYDLFSLFSLLFLKSFIDISFTYYKIHPFKAYNWMVFSIIVFSKQICATNTSQF